MPQISKIRNSALDIACFIPYYIATRGGTMHTKCIIFLLALTNLIFASERTVVAEEFIRVTCPYCPGAARGLRENYARSYDSLLVIAVHTAAPFLCTDGSARISYYGISGVPTVKIDGILSTVGGVSAPGTMYPTYLHQFTTRATIDSPLEIALDCTYDTVSNIGSVTTTIENTSASTVSGILQFSIIENSIPYSWGGGLTTVEHVLRDMLPDAAGESVTIPSSDTIIRSRDFTISGAWDEENCNIVVFVQAASREIYQGAEIDILKNLNVDYYGLTMTELSGNGNGVAEPGEQIRMFIKGKNNGTEVYSGTTTINSSSPYISITNTNPQSVAIEPGDVDTVLNIDIAIDAGCPSPYTWNFDITFNSGDMNTISFIISHATGFYDNMESGQGGWTHTGSIDNWHLTEHKSNSPTHSWYCGVENSWLYTDRNDASLISPNFVVTPDSALRFFHQYALETGYDYTYAEIDNNCGWWHILGEFNGILGSWTEQTYSLSTFSGQTARLRFRFISDANTTAEGWYIDDVRIPNILAIKENKSSRAPLTMHVAPNPFTSRLNITCNYSGLAQIKIYDASGRLIRDYEMSGSDARTGTHIIWNGTDQHGDEMASGVYFVRLVTDEKTITEKTLLVR
jgi:hypothetical protein